MAEPTAAPVAPAVPEVPIPETEVAPEATPVATRKIKWGDTEKEVSFEEAAQLAEKAFGIENKARAHAAKVESAEKLVSMLQTDYKGFAKQCRSIGIDPQKLASDLLMEQIRVNTLSPEQKELEELKEKQAEEDAIRNEQQAAIKAAEVNKKTQEWAQKFEQDLMKALEARNIPISRLALALTAQYIDAGLADGKEFTTEQVLPYVLRDLKNVQGQTLGSLEGEALLQYIGDDVSNKVAAARVARYKKGPVAKKEVPAAPKKQSEDLKKLKGRAYWAALRRMKSEEGIGAFPGE